MKPWQILVAIGIGAFVGVVVVCGGLGFWIARETLVPLQAAMTPGSPGISYQLNGPAQVQVGRPFTLEATITNSGATAQTLHSLENYSGLTIHSSTPAWQNRQGSLMTYQLSIPAGGQQIIRLEVEASTDGPHFANIDANINNYMNYVEGWCQFTAVAPTTSP